MIYLFTRSFRLLGIRLFPAALDGFPRGFSVNTSAIGHSSAILRLLTTTNTPSTMRSLHHILLILASSLSLATAGDCEGTFGMEARRVCHLNNNNRIACIKVLDDVKEMLGKENARKKPQIEAALGEYCAKSTLSSKEKKICYYMYVPFIATTQSSSHDIPVIPSNEMSPSHFPSA